ncbi:MAG: ATP-binding protein [Pseudomonadota bacterium]
MKVKLGSTSVLVQVALLVVFAVVVSQAAVFAAVLLAPPPRPAGFSISEAVNALEGRAAETADGRALTRRLSDQPGVSDVEPGPVERGLTQILAQHLDVPAQSVRVRMAGERAPLKALLRPSPPRRLDGETSVQQVQSFVFERREQHSVLAPRQGEAVAARAPDAPPLPPPPPAPPIRLGTDGSVRVFSRNGPVNFNLAVEQLTFAPFIASVRQPDGQWATVGPPRGWIDPWQARLLSALLITLLLMAPLVWLLTRRLTRPIRAFAEAAERLGANPDAEPLIPSGPSEVRTAIAAFNDMQASIRDHMRQRTQTIAAIAHDLRTPLTRLRFRAEQSPEALRDKMAGDVEEMDALIGQAMAFVRGEAQAERCEALDLAALAEACAGGFAETGAAVTFVGGKPLPVLGDPGALRRAVANLIDNAVKFAGTARVEAVRSGDSAVITVSDTGPGLPDDELDAVFEPFHRGERSRNRQTGGAGLGLAVARQAARAAGGEVTLANRSGGGLKARLSLPLSS